MSAEQFKQHVTRELYKMVDNDSTRVKVYNLMMYCYQEGVKSGEGK